MEKNQVFQIAKVQKVARERISNGNVTIKMSICHLN